MAHDIILDPKRFSRRDRARLEKYRAQLADLASTDKAVQAITIRLSVGDAEEDVLLPAELSKALAAALTEMADGHIVHVSRVDDEVTTTEAADLLNVSRPHLVRLLDEGTIPHRKVGTHRRVRRADVLAYREQSYRQAQEALQELTDQAQELGLGYE